MEKWSRLKYTPCLPLGENGRLATASEKHINLSRMVANEGMVLLKNNEDVLPIKKGNTVALFGLGSVAYVKCGAGSGSVETPYVHNIYDGLLIKESENKIYIIPELYEFYKNYYINECKSNTDADKTYLEPNLDLKLLELAKNATDTAIIAIFRVTGEGKDYLGKFDSGDYYLREDELNLIKVIKQNFKKIIITLNTGNVIDSSWFYKDDKIDSVLLAWQGGIEGGLAIADVLCGDVTPSGKLCDTLAADIKDYPSTNSFYESDDYVEYTEDIYVGYRYFESSQQNQEKVNYPFGYGLSYTKFIIENSIEETEQGVAILSKVTNVGNYSGKEVVQVYFSCPSNKIKTPALQLCSFKKTKELCPGESETVQNYINYDRMSAFDDNGAISKSAFVMEKGKYVFYVGNSIRDVEPIYSYILNENRIIKQCKSLLAPKKLSKRMKTVDEFEFLPVEEYSENKYHCNYDLPGRATKYQPIQLDSRDTEKPDDRKSLLAVYNNEITLKEFISQMSTEDLIDLVGGKPNTGVADVHGFGDMYGFGVPPVMCCDGPAGLRISADRGVTTTAWPCATLFGCTWNTGLMFEIGKACALEVKENNLGMWLAPALNIHRSPLCGRNFEYFSEDPYVSGILAAAEIEGIQSQGIAACPKHFACNNKETNRLYSDSRVSERALREIYLKGFEIAITMSKPWSIMSSYNLINGVHSSENNELLEKLLREEWGYEGMISSDWYNTADPILEIKAGNNLRMPFGSNNRLQIAVKNGILDRSDLEKNVFYVLSLILKLS